MKKERLIQLNKLIKGIIVFLLVIINTNIYGQEISKENRFEWPDGKKMAISLSWDDGRSSQPSVGIPFLNKYGIKATFYVTPSSVERSLEGWKDAVKNGQEIGNHTMYHPCSVNFGFGSHTLENMNLEEFKYNLIESNKEIKQLLGVTPVSFAYPCGMSYVGVGKETQSYVPVVAEMFASGRMWLGEAPNNPLLCNFSQLTGVKMDGKDFDQILPLIEDARIKGDWLLLAGHEMSSERRPENVLSTRLQMLKKLIEYAQDPRNEIWIAPVGEVLEYIKEHRIGK